MSGLFKSTTIKGTRITDFAKTSADVGSTIPFLHGRAPVQGNVIWAHLPPKESKQTKKQGKGGVKQETYTYTVPYAIAFCRGPIQGYWWIKRNGKVVYSQDPNAPVEDKEYAAKWAANVMMYNGTSSQMPSSLIESYEGVGRVSAFRYLSYITVPPEDVTDQGGAVPSYEAVPIASPSEVYITSHPYVQLEEEFAEFVAGVRGGELRTLLREAPSDDAASYRTQLRGGYLGIKLLSAEDIEHCTLDVTLAGGELRAPLVTVASEEEALYGVVLHDGVLKRQLVTTTLPLEKCSYTPTLAGGTLS